MKLGVNPTAWMATIGDKANNTEQLLRALNDEYNDWCRSNRSYNDFTRLAQGTASLSDHHKTLHMMLQGMNESLTTKNPLVISTYINSISDEGLQKRLRRKQDSSPGMITLQELIEISTNETRLNEELRERRQATAAQVEASPPVNNNTGVAAAAVPMNNRPVDANMFCEIHNSRTHSTKECRSANRTDCPICHKTVEAGKLVEHIVPCRATRNTSIKCFKCDEIGHFARDCTNKRRRSRSRSRSRSPPRHRRRYNDSRGHGDRSDRRDRDSNRRRRDDRRDDRDHKRRREDSRDDRKHRRHAHVAETGDTNNRSDSSSGSESD